jgi:DNA polymerase-1
MLLQADARQLEMVAAAYLSQDKVMMREIWDGVDMHADNQLKLNLPSRLIAKTFVFRLIYGGSAFSYAHDHNFTHVSTDETYWQNVIDAFYRKYRDLNLWHKDIVNKATRDEKLVMPTGRTYYFKPELTKFGKVKYPRTRILNYPVQGLGADLMSIARVSLYNNLLNKPGIKLVNTVHDSIILDVDINVNSCYNISKIVENCFNNVPSNFEKLFGHKFNLPMRVEIQVGNTWGDMKIYEVGNK